MKDKEKPIYKKWWFWLIVIVVIIIGYFSINLYLNAPLKENNIKLSESYPILKEYRQKAINLFEEYKENKSTITIEQLQVKITDLQYEFDEKYKEQENVYLDMFSTKLMQIASNLYLDNNRTTLLTNQQIDDYIAEIQAQ